MPSKEHTIPVSMDLPQSVFDEVDELARREDRSVEEELAILVGNGLDASRSAGEGFRRLSEDYRSRLKIEGRLSDPPDIVWEDLRRIREEVANEFYPD